MFGLAIERDPNAINEDGTPMYPQATAIPVGAISCTVSPTCPDGYMFRTDSSGTTVLPDGTVMALAPPTGGIVATRNPDGSLTVGAGNVTTVPVNQTPIPVQNAHKTLTDLINSLSGFSPLASLQAHPYIALGGLAFIYFTFHKKGRR